MLSIIVATDNNNGIGKDNKLLFHIPQDLKRFKELTTEKCVIMGRKTFESLPNGALPNRVNIVTTRNTKDLFNSHEIEFMTNEKLFYSDDIDKLINLYKNSKEEIFVIGGGEIYNKLLPYCNKIYLTRVLSEFEADTFFKYNKNEWKINNCSELLSSNGYDYYFIDLVRKRVK